MTQPEGFREEGNKADWVCKLKKGLYGLKQGGRLWYERLGKALEEMGFQRTKSDSSVYVWAKDGINGNAPFGDPAVTGSNNDFRIFNNALTAAQVTQLDTLGANATDAQIAAALVPEPSTVALLTIIGTGGLFLRRRRA